MPVRMTPTGGTHHHSLMNGRSLRNRFSNQSS
nr:MAG TPA_asm: Methyl-accepting chemotaxis protein, phycoviolobilin binding, SIGNALING PROTEIN [Caudoviricetes sp.]